MAETINLETAQDFSLVAVALAVNGPLTESDFFIATVPSGSPTTLNNVTLLFSVEAPFYPNHVHWNMGSSSVLHGAIHLLNYTIDGGSTFVPISNVSHSDSTIHVGGVDLATGFSIPIGTIPDVSLFSFRGFALASSNNGPGLDGVFVRTDLDFVRITHSPAPLLMMEA